MRQSHLFGRTLREVDQMVRGRKKGKPHAAAHDWRKLVDQGLAVPLPDDAEEREIETRARDEKWQPLQKIRILMGAETTQRTRERR